MRTSRHTGNPGCRCRRRDCSAARRAHREAHRATLERMPIGLSRLATPPPAQGSAARATPTGPLVRSTTVRTPRPRRPESPTYLEWVRMLPCALAGRPGHGLAECMEGLSGVEAHHVRSRGAGGPDLVAIPLCHAAHIAAHAGLIARDERREWWTQVIGAIEAAP